MRRSVGISGLQAGEDVKRPKYKHYRIQQRLQELLFEYAGRSMARDAKFYGAVIGIEFAFRPVPEYELRVADVAYVAPERAAAIDLEDNLRGAPELVIEILSPSNSAAEMADKQTLCLDYGTREFWVVDPHRKRVTVWTPDYRAVTYQTGQEIPLDLFGSGMLPVDRIFEGIC